MRIPGFATSRKKQLRVKMIVFVNTHNITVKRNGAISNENELETM